MLPVNEDAAEVFCLLKVDTRRTIGFASLPILAVPHLMANCMSCKVLIVEHDERQADAIMLSRGNLASVSLVLPEKSPHQLYNLLHAMFYLFLVLPTLPSSAVLAFDLWLLSFACCVIFGSDKERFQLPLCPFALYSC